ncbi:MAG: helix-turn-helix domain-containing protein [Candidatus Omnitrophota bacterium]
MMRLPRSFTDEQRKELRESLKNAKSKDEYLRIQCVWLLALLNLTPYQIAETLGLSVSRVKQIQGRYFREGMQALLDCSLCGRRR